MQAYKIDNDILLESLKVDPQKGILSEAIVQRQKEYGYNVLKIVKHRTIISIFISQFQKPLVYILFFAALIIFFFF